MASTYSVSSTYLLAYLLACVCSSYIIVLFEDVCNCTIIKKYIYVCDQGEQLEQPMARRSIFNKAPYHYSQMLCVTKCILALPLQTANFRAVPVTPEGGGRGVPVIDNSTSLWIGSSPYRTG